MVNRSLAVWVVVIASATCGPSDIPPSIPDIDPTFVDLKSGYASGEDIPIHMQFKNSSANDGIVYFNFVDIMNVTTNTSEADMIPTTKPTIVPAGKTIQVNFEASFRAPMTMQLLLCKLRSSLEITAKGALGKKHRDVDSDTFEVQ